MLILIFTAALIIPLQAETQLPLHQKKLSDRALVVWTGDLMQTIAVVALATEKGIVVIETNIVRDNDIRIRQAIEKEFGRKDFAYLINTHFHHDHTAGNQVYSDAVIIGHKTVPAGMRSELTGEGLVKMVDKFKLMLEEREELLKKLEPGNDRHKFTNEFIILLKLAIKELQSGFIPTYPSIVFEKNLTLDMGDMTIELYSFGGMHTDSDIVIFVPEEGLVALGDVAPEQMLPYIRKDLKSDFKITLEHWGRIVNHESEIKYVNMAHSDMHLSVQTFKEQYNYLHSLWQGLEGLHQQGLTLADAMQKYTIDKDFPYFKDKILKTRRGSIHENNVEAIWERIKHK